MSAPTAVEVAAAALTMIGAQPIASLDEGTTEAIVVNQLYEMVVQGALSDHPWRFAIGQIQLNRLAAAPIDTVWSGAYQLPAEPRVMAIRAIRNGGASTRFDRYEDKIFCDAAAQDIVTADIVFRAQEPFWPPYFTLYAAYRLAAALAGSITRDAGIIDMMSKLAEGQLVTARTTDSQGRTAQRTQSVRRMIQRRR